MDESLKHKIVIVEDEGLIAEDIRRQLIAAGYQVPGVADAAPEAMRIIRAASPDLVLMDIRIKGEQDGIHVAQRVHEDLDVPVVFLTAYEDARTLERASEAHPYGYIRKPISGASLRGSIEIAIAKHRCDRQVREQRDWAVNSFAAIPCAVVLTDSKGRVSWLNSAAGKLTGHSTESAFQRPCAEILPLVDALSGTSVDDLVVAAILSGETITLPAGAMLARGGEKENIPVEGSVAPASPKEIAAGAVIAFQDATRVRFDEEQRLLASKHSAVQRVLRNIARRLPNLRLVDAAWDTMLMTEGRNTSPELRHKVETMHGAVMDCYSVATQLSALLESPDVHPESVILNELLPRIEAELQPNAPRLNMLVSEAPIHVHADGENLKNALITFVRHARRRMKKSGPLVIDVSHPPMGNLRHWVRIRLSYPAVGRAARALDRAFEPRWQNSGLDPYKAYESITRMGGMLMTRVGGNDTVAVEIYLRQIRTVAAGETFHSGRVMVVD